MHVTIKTWPEKIILSTRRSSIDAAGATGLPLKRVDEAMRWLRPQLGQSLVMKKLRMLLLSEKIPNVEKMNDLQIAQCASSLLIKQRLILIKPQALKFEPAVIVVERTVAPPVVETVPAPREQPAIAPAPEQVDNTDYEAQAETLKTAAKEGAPFCEECEKAKPEAKQNAA